MLPNFMIKTEQQQKHLMVRKDIFLIFLESFFPVTLLLSLLDRVLNPPEGDINKKGVKEVYFFPTDIAITTSTNNVDIARLCNNMQTKGRWCSSSIELHSVCLCF